MNKTFLIAIISIILTSFCYSFTNKNTFSLNTELYSPLDTFPTHVTGNPNIMEVSKGPTTSLIGTIDTRYSDTSLANTTKLKLYPGARIIVGNTSYIRDSTATKWIISSGGGSGASGIIPGGPISSNDIIGFNPGTTISTDSFIIKTFYQSQAPIATLTGGIALEFRSAQTLNYTLNWSGGRQGSTAPLSTIVVAGINQAFSQPSPSSNVSGVQAVSFAANTNITYSNIVTTTDGKTANTTSTFSFLPQRYSGWISDTTGIGVTGFDDSRITALTNELTFSKSKGSPSSPWLTGNPTGTQFYVYAYYSTAGDLTQFDFNGFPTIEAMNHVTRTFTNALGFTGMWTIYWNKNGQTLSSSLIAN